MPADWQIERRYRTWLKAELFRRDGYGKQRALCAFGCGTELTWRTATLDRYPIPGREGGTYHPANTRLACHRCNTQDGAAHAHQGDVSLHMSPAQKAIWKRVLRNPGDRIRLMADESKQRPVTC